MFYLNTLLMAVLFIIFFNIQKRKSSWTYHLFSFSCAIVEDIRPSWKKGWSTTTKEFPNYLLKYTRRMVASLSAFVNLIVRRFEMFCHYGVIQKLDTLQSSARIAWRVSQIPSILLHLCCLQLIPQIHQLKTNSAKLNKLK